MFSINICVTDRMSRGSPHSDEDNISSFKLSLFRRPECILRRIYGRNKTEEQEDVILQEAYSYEVPKMMK